MCRTMDVSRCSKHVSDSFFLRRPDNFHIFFSHFPDNKMYRGCQSDFNETNSHCRSHPELCKLCEGNGCNDHDRTRKPTLNCVYCNRTDDCEYGQLPMSMIIRTCRADVLFPQNETCFINRANRINGVSRGCTLDIDQTDRWCKDNGNCTQCAGDKCNRENAFPLHCHKCIGSGCDAKQNQTTSIVCPGIFGRLRTGCYTNVTGRVA